MSSDTISATGYSSSTTISLTIINSTTIFQFNSKLLFKTINQQILMQMFHLIIQHQLNLMKAALHSDTANKKCEETAEY